LPDSSYAEFLREVGAGVADGIIRYREDIVDGLEKAPETFIGMLEGKNFGKVIERVRVRLPESSVSASDRWG
jgi:NADPH-dependent curcumin reductase CurA